MTVVALLAVYAEPNGMPKPLVEQHLRQRGVDRDLTVGERAFLSKPAPSETDRGPFTWQYESAHVLLWALGYADMLARPDEYCTAAGVSAVVAGHTVDQLTVGARLRPSDDLFDALDLTYRYHWATREALLRARPAPAGLIAPVCHYRHYALNWLTDSRLAWDDVDTST